MALWNYAVNGRVETECAAHQSDWRTRILAARIPSESRLIFAFGPRFRT